MSKSITRGVALSQSIAANKTADEVMNSIIAYVRPTAEISMWLTKVEPKASGDSNWNAGAEPMTPALLRTFLEIIEAMRASYPIVEWDAPADLKGSPQRIYRRGTDHPDDEVGFANAKTERKLSKNGS